MFLVDKFQQFYVELLRLREKATGGSWIVADAETPATAESLSSYSVSASVWNKLYALLQRQSAEAEREGGDVGKQVYEQAQYAMAALADEVFLHLPWAGKEAWREQLLESRLFNSHNAGEDLFRRIRALLADRNRLHRELARVYLSTLALGFEGKYRGDPAGAQEIEALRRHLYRYIFGRDPVAIKGNEVLMPQAYSMTLNEAQPTALPYMRPWIIAIVLILVAWIGIGHVIWINATQQVRPVLEDLLHEDSVKPLPPSSGGTK